MQPGTAMCFMNFYILVFWTPLVSVRVFRIPAWPNDICQWSQDNDFNIQVIYKIQIHYPMYYVCTKRLHFVITCKLQYWLRYSQKALKTDRGWCTWQFEMNHDNIWSGKTACSSAVYLLIVLVLSLSSFSVLSYLYSNPGQACCLGLDR